MDDALRARLDGIVGLLGLLIAAVLVRPVLPSFVSGLLGITVAVATVGVVLFGLEE